jgi:malate dehydrogenase (oxaloacetate-decarboxylating)(NADP+)|tara:strand:+ start:330 stop:560 length:231 start_codon:yes stop_codon:yes gene_type:complete
MFIAAAEALAADVGDADWREGRVFPPLGRVRALSLDIATAVARVAYERGLAMAPAADDLHALIEAHVYDPSYDRIA